MTNEEAFNRGFDDCRADRAPIFRSTRARGIVPAIDDPQADDWSNDLRQSYLTGYDTAGTPVDWE